MATITDTRVQGTKASLQLTSANGQAWWVDTSTAAGAIMHRIHFDKNARTSKMDPITGKGTGAGTKAGPTDLPH